MTSRSTVHIAQGEKSPVPFQLPNSASDLNLKGQPFSENLTWTKRLVPGAL